MQCCANTSFLASSRKSSLPSRKATALDVSASGANARRHRLPPPPRKSSLRPYTPHLQPAQPPTVVASRHAATLPSAMAKDDVGAAVITAASATPSRDRITAGQRIYTSPVLSMYDLIVLQFSNTHLWRCPTAEQLAHYNAHISAHHLDCGVGTGYYLQHCLFPTTSSPKITLLDLNPNCLETAAKRIAQYNPACVQADLFQALPLTELYQSIGLGYVLHCLPGDMAVKTQVLANLKQHLAPGGVLFGSTILGSTTPGVEQGWLARKVAGLYNAKGVFSNAKDDLEGLTGALDAHFGEVELRLVGSVALFAVREPKGV